jgi:hypothetical protein
MYSLHAPPGRPDGYVLAGGLGIRMDALIAAGRVQPFLAALPYGKSGVLGNDTEWANTKVGAYESFVLNTVRAVDSRWATEAGAGAAALPVSRRVATAPPTSLSTTQACSACSRAGPDTSSRPRPCRSRERLPQCSGPTARAPMSRRSGRCCGTNRWGLPVPERPRWLSRGEARPLRPGAASGGRPRPLRDLPRWAQLGLVAGADVPDARVREPLIRRPVMQPPAPGQQTQRSLRATGRAATVSAGVPSRDNALPVFGAGGN